VSSEDVTARMRKVKPATDWMYAVAAVSVGVLGAGFIVAAVWAMASGMR